MRVVGCYLCVAKPNFFMKKQVYTMNRVMNPGPSVKPRSKRDKAWLGKVGFVYLQRK